ncbi:ERCC5 protein, partial [Calyptomena viridis]|nr:ERCC5 protein [Calyptomena viridis]
LFCFEDSNDFSQYQLRGLLKKSNLNRCIENVQKEMNQQHSGEIQTQYENEGGFVKEVESRRVVSEETSHYILIKGIQAKEAIKKDLESTGGPSSKILEFTRLNKTNESSANAKVVVSDKMEMEKDNNVVTAPPSPRTLLAIQAAMVESSSEEELDTGQVNVNKFVTEEGSVSPRTLRAIQQALNDDDDEKEEVVTVRTDGVLPERSEVKDFLLCSSDEEGQIPEVKEGKNIPTAAICSSIQVTMHDAEFGQKSQELEKNDIIPKDTNTGISSAENYSCIDNTRKGKEDLNKEENVSKRDLMSLGDKDMNLCVQKPSCSVQTGVGALIHVETTDLSKNEDNLKISENIRELISQTEEDVPEVQKDIRFFLEERGPEEEREDISQSEDSDSDG